MITLTVYFEDPWWVGIVTHDEVGTTRAYRHVFGSEPSSEEVLTFVLHDFIALTSRASTGVAAETEAQRRPRVCRVRPRLVTSDGVPRSSASFRPAPKRVSGIGGTNLLVREAMKR